LRFTVALKNSEMIKLGSDAPSFSLPDTDGNLISIENFTNSRALLVMFICNHCPYVKHVRDGLVSLANKYLENGVGIVGINSNDVDNYPDDSPEKMAEEVKKYGYRFPYLFDKAQEVAKSYRAACTPDFFLYDENRKLVYRGQMDDSRPVNGIPVTGNDLRKALDDLLSGNPITNEQKPSVGCNIKWIPGNEPDYFK
jgi:peroxiredoxin